jgi:hypothetical protein
MDYLDEPEPAAERAQRLRRVFRGPLDLPDRRTSFSTGRRGSKRPRSRTNESDSEEAESSDYLEASSSDSSAEEDFASEGEDKPRRGRARTTAGPSKLLPDLSQSLLLHTLSSIRAQQTNNLIRYDKNAVLNMTVAELLVKLAHAQCSDIVRRKTLK